LSGLCLSLSLHAACPTITDSGEIDVETPVNGVSRGKSFERSLPIVKSASVTNPEPEYLEPFGVCRIGSRYYQLDAIDTAETSEKISLRMYDGEMAVLAKPSINHVLGLNSFNEETSGATKTSPLIDYSTLEFTVAVKTDERLQVIYTSPTFENSDNPKTLYIDIDDAEAWVVLPGTILGVSSGSLVRQSATEANIVRDDSDRLRRIAALAMAFYSRPRYAMDIMFRQIRSIMRPGQYLVDVYEGTEPQPAGAIVSSVTWDFQAGTTMGEFLWVLMGKCLCFFISKKNLKRFLGEELVWQL